MIVFQHAFTGVIFFCILVFVQVASFISKTNRIIRGSSPVLFGKGEGKAKTYSWIENRREIEVTVKVPKETTSKEIVFKSTPFTVDLRLTKGRSDGDSNIEKAEILLNGERQLRGKICMDGTYWSIEDFSEDDSASLPFRLVKVCIEKHRFMGDVECDDDWGGVFLDDKHEVLSREYEDEEELDVAEYTKKLGVNLEDLKPEDIDQSMYSSADMTQGMFEKLLESGFAREVLNEQNRVEQYMSNPAPVINSTIYQPVDNSDCIDAQNIESDNAVSEFDDEEESVKVEVLEEKESSLESLETTFRKLLGGKFFL